MLKRMIPALCALAACAAPGQAAAADTTIAADPAAQQVTALAGTVVWVSGRFGSQRLMQRTGTGAPTPVAGAPTARAYRSVDLGLDAGGDLVLTYLRCSTASRCAARRDDLQGHRRSFRGLEPARCSLTTAPALWRTRAAYGLECRTRSGALDRPRSGLFVRAGSRARRIALPRDAARFGVTLIDSVDLRGSQVGAVAADIYEYAFSARVTGGGLHSFLAAASEGDSNESAAGLALGSGGALWALVDSEHAGDPNVAVIYRQAGSCVQSERMANAPGTDAENGFRAIDVAVDGAELYLVVPGTGIVSHPFVGERAC